MQYIDFDQAVVRGDLREIGLHLEQAPGLVAGVTPSSGWTPLQLAAWFGHAPVVALLLARGAGIDARSEHPHVLGGSTALHLAAIGGHRDVVSLLIGRGAQLELRDAAGLNPLHAACLAGRVQVAAQLITAGADVNAYSGDQTPLSMALDTDQGRLAAIILEAGGIC